MNAQTINGTLRPASAQTTKRDELITEHLHLVSAIAAHIQSSIPVHVELDDLVHAGTMGLFDAATKYREDKEVAFPTYAKHRIRGAILDSLRQQDCMSRDLRARYKQVKAVTEELATKLGRTPTDAEVANAIGLNSRRWQSLMVDFRKLSALALQLHPHEGDEECEPEILGSATNRPDKILQQKELSSKLNSAMKTLPGRYQQVVKMYYEKELSMKQIGRLLGVNESRVSQIHKSALGKMQGALQIAGIESSNAFAMAA